MAVTSPQTQVVVDNLLPPELRFITNSDSLLSSFSAHDYVYGQWVVDAAAVGQVLRYVAVIDVATGLIGAQLGRYDNDHPFATLKRCDNMVLIYSKRYTDPIIIRGPGAGPTVTASNVVADIVQIATRLAARCVY